MHVFIKVCVDKGNKNIDEVMSPQFYQHIPAGGVIHLGTESGLIDARIVLEGTEIIFGLQLTQIQGADYKAKHKTLTEMAAASFLQLVGAHGFCFTAKAGCGIVLPPTFAYVIVNPNESGFTHGVRWQFLGEGGRVTDTIHFLASPSRLSQSCPLAHSARC